MQNSKSVIQAASSYKCRSCFFINVGGENGPSGKLGASSGELTYEKISAVPFFFCFYLNLLQMSDIASPGYLILFLSM
jgi:hypothetical protein